MNIKFSAQFYRLVQQVVVIGVMIALVLAGTDLRIIGLGPRIMFVGIAALGFLTISISCIRQPQQVRLLLSPADAGWIALIMLTGTTVILAPFPRRSLEIWLLTTGLQLPLAYVTLLLLRLRWSERTIYRGLLAVGGYVFSIGILTSLVYVIQIWNAHSTGVYVPPFRLYAVLDNPSILAMFIAITTPCMVGYLLMGVRRFERFLIVLWLIGAAITIVASGTRSGAIALLIGVAAALLLGLMAHPSQPLRRFQQWAAMYRRLAGTLIVTVVIVTVIGLAAFFYILSAAPNHADSSDRFNLYKTALLSFSQHPLAGQGPGGFVLAEEQFHSIPPFLIVPHAHNMVLNSAAEGGVIGLAGLLIFLGMTAYISWKAWQTQPQRRPILAGAVGGLIGFLASGLLESPMSQPGLFFLAGVLLMLIASGLPVTSRASIRRTALLLLPMTVIVFLAAMLMIYYSVFWQITYTNSIVFNENIEVVTTGAIQLDQLKNLDPTDPLVMLQSAYMWSHVATLSTDLATTTAAIQTTIERLEQAIRYDPYLGMHYLNLSVLYAKVNRQEDAVRAAQHAVELASEDPAAQLNLGLRLEATNDIQHAQAAYFQAMKLEPAWAQAGFWQSSQVRQAALEQFKVEPLTDTQKFEELIRAGDVARRAGKVAEATDVYYQTQKLTSSLAWATLVKGLVAWTNDDLDQANLHLSNTTNMGDFYVSSKAWYYLGTLAEARGDTMAMSYAYSRLYDLLTSRGVQGFGSANNVLYSTQSFRRFGLVSDYLPDVTLLDITPDYANCLKSLAQARANDGDKNGAIRIYRAILQANPLDNDAQAALQALAK